MLDPKDIRIAVIGLGYVGLPLSVEFGKLLPTVGFDIDAKRIEELRAGRDRTLETTTEELELAKNLSFTDDLQALEACNVYIITVPTPIDSYKRPDLTPLIKASQAVGRIISKGNVVIYESTVYPGATEEDCVPIIAEISGLVFNQDFFAGYSPERINPGDKSRRLTNICKITSGSTETAGVFVDGLYRMIINAGTHLAPSIRVAEAAKVIENTQRDVNIALINELAVIFDRLNINTRDVLSAARTKWNFLDFQPGLVGGHCIGVDPYYLTHKAQSVGYHPEVVLAGRRINDSMGSYVAQKFIKTLIARDVLVRGADILIFGLTFKEDCPDIRNTKVIDLIRDLESYGVKVDVYDPMVDKDQAMHEYGIEVLDEIPAKSYAGAIIAVAHRPFREMGPELIRSHLGSQGVLFDIKAIFDAKHTDGQL